MKAGEYAPGVEFDAGVAGNHYLGSAQALIAAGLIAPEHIPKVSSVTFFNGVKVDGRRVRGMQDERWMQVRVVGSRLQVTKGIGREERARREAARQQEAEDLLRTSPRKDPGADGVRMMDYRASAALQVGEQVFIDGCAATISGAFKQYVVQNEKGQFTDGERRWDYLSGYLCRIHESGKEFFYPAHAIEAKSGARTHLRLVSGASPRREIGFSIRSLA